MKARTAVALAVANLLCAPFLYLGVKFGRAYGYTTADWLQAVFVPNFETPLDVFLFPFGLAVVLIPLATAILALVWLVGRLTRSISRQSAR